MSDDWTGQIAITGMGLVTPVGLKADVAIAAMRAGISRLGELPYLDIEVDEDEFAPVIGAEVPVIPEGQHGTAKLVRFVAHSVADAISDARLENKTVVEVFLGTAGDRPAERVLNQTPDLKDALIEAIPAGLQVRDVNILPVGRAAALQAIRAAAQLISAGEVQVAIAGGVDSWAQPRSLLWLREQKRLREFPRRTGILPGEAGGFLVLESVSHARSRGAAIQAFITSAAGQSQAARDDKPEDGRTLGETLKSAVQGINDPHALVVSDFNGERYRAHEWMLAVPKGMWRYETLRHWHPAEYVGDTGAASGVISTAWAAQALHRGYAKTPHVLVWGASDEGAREALLVGGSEGAA